MKKEVKYILTEEQVTCVGDVRTAKADLEKMADKILKENHIPPQYAEFMYSVADRLGFALKALELEEK